MTHLLAQTLPDPNSSQAVGWFVLTFGGILGIVVLGATLIRFFRPTPPIHQHYATKDELRALEERFTDAHRELGEKIDAHAEKYEANVVRIHERLDKQMDRIVEVIKEGASK